MSRFSQKIEDAGNDRSETQTGVAGWHPTLRMGYALAGWHPTLRMGYALAGWHPTLRMGYALRIKKADRP